MFNILTLNKISKVGTSRLGENYTCGDDVANPDAVLVRSAAMHDMEFGENLLAIARAGAGTNNIPKDRCTEQGIVVFNTPGANANAVKELVLAGLLLSSRKITEGIDWIKTLKGNGEQVGKMVEKGKMEAARKEAAIAKIKDTMAYEDCADADLVIEVVAEDMAIKKEIFQTLDKICKPEAILATNTSSLSITEIASFTTRPQNVIGMHFFNPVPMMKLVEVIKGQ